VDSIKIGPVRYRVEIVEDLKGEEGEELHGHIEDATRTIRLNTKAPDDGRYVTTWHEIIHALESLYGLILTEQDINILATSITQVLQDNPGMNWSQYANEGKVRRVDPEILRRFGVNGES
jgi:hypothetical protein